MPSRSSTESSATSPARQLLSLVGPPAGLSTARRRGRGDPAGQPGQPVPVGRRRRGRRR